MLDVAPSSDYRAQSTAQDLDEAPKLGSRRGWLPAVLMACAIAGAGQNAQSAPKKSRKAKVPQSAPAIEEPTRLVPPSPPPQPPTPAVPDPPPDRPALFVGLGAYSPAIAKYTSSPEGTPSAFARFQFPLQVALSVPIAANLRTLPQLQWSGLLPRRHPEGRSATDVLLIRAPFARSVLDRAFELTIGVAYKETRIYGEGGIVTQNNGTSTATFAAPGDSRSARGLMLEFGAQKEWRRTLFAAAITSEALLNDKRRTFGLLLTVSYRAWEFEWR